MAGSRPPCLVEGADNSGHEKLLYMPPVESCDATYSGFACPVGTSGPAWVTPQPSPSVHSGPLPHYPVPTMPEGSLQHQHSSELLQSSLPELFSWANTLHALQTSETLSALSSPASCFSDDPSLLQSADWKGQQTVGEPCSHVLIDHDGSTPPEGQAPFEGPT